MIGRLLAFLFPSVPRQLSAEVTLTPGPARSGEAAAGPGQTPESGGGCSPSSGLSPFSGPPACETQVAFYPHPSVRWEFGDERLGALIDRWRGARS
ncbi:hypothetical protein GCM10009606_18070 [Nocardioides aquiterrae]|uniref:Secreted protein n=1 Tax=Nocardioides aquiterrae TaxID=203799 RepID=A0ABP4EY20_9ACTN